MSATSRLLTLLALLAGLLAMHGLAGGAHAAHAAAAQVPHTAADGKDMAAALDMPMPSEPALASAIQPSGPGAVSSTARHGGAVMDAMALCLVVLVSVGVALLGPALSPHSLRRTAVPLRSRLRATPAPRGPPPDLLSQLCVLRT